MSSFYEEEIKKRCDERPGLLDEKISQFDLILGDNSGMFDALNLVRRSNLIKIRKAIIAEEPFSGLTSCDIAEVYNIVFS